MYLNKNGQEIFQKWSFFLTQKKKFSQNTVSAYLTDLQIFFKFFCQYKAIEFIDIKDIEKLEIEEIRGFLSERNNQEIDASTRSREISALKNFLKFIKEECQLNLPVIDLITYPKLSKSLPKAINFNEIEKILSVLNKGKDWVSYRDYLIVWTIYATGLRISEILNLTLKDVNKDFLAIKGKGDKERYVPLLDENYQKIQIYLKKTPYQIKDYIFLGEKGAKLNPRIIQRKISSIRNEFLLPEWTTPHSLRHSFASHLLQDGVNLREIQEMLGHKNLITTERYTAIDKEKLLANYKNFHPREGE